MRFKYSIALHGFLPGEQLVHEAIRQIMAARAIHNIFKTTESRLLVSSQVMRWMCNRYLLDFLPVWDWCIANVTIPVPWSRLQTVRSV